MSNENNNQRHFYLELSFDGTGFEGWQSQPSGNTVQDVLQEKLSVLYGNVPIKVNGSGRTDAGVHALGMGVSYTTPPEPDISEAQVVKALNSLLPNTIMVREIKPIDETFHARFSANGKAYTYVINTGPVTPFLSRWSWHRPKCVHIDSIRESLEHLQGEHDFSAFTVRNKDVDDPVRTIYRIDLLEYDQLICITFIGNGFLYKMVRGMIGTVIAIGQGKYSPDIIKTLIDSKDRSAAEPTAPAQGLFLMKVFYEQDTWKNFSLEQPPFYH